jgi:hypothetical protein
MLLQIPDPCEPVIPVPCEEIYGPPIPWPVAALQVVILLTVLLWAERLIEWYVFSAFPQHMIWAKVKLSRRARLSWIENHPIVGNLFFNGPMVVAPLMILITFFVRNSRS